MSDPRLWGWLTADQPDPLTGKGLAESRIARLLGLAGLDPTPPVALDPETVPPSRLTADQRVALSGAFAGGSVDYAPIARASAMLGQSYPDQLVRRSGRVERAADAVVEPCDAAEVQTLLDAARRHGFRVMACGGGSNVVGAFDADADPRPVVACSMRAMTAVVEVNARDMTATAQAGIRLPELEARLAVEGLTLGHFPQSFEAATLGGAIAANGAGQRSDGYGRIGERLVSARLATPSGPWAADGSRHASAGPWTGGLVAGSEGLFGVVTDATLALHAKPDTVVDEAWFLPDFASGVEAARAIAQTDPAAAMVRVSDAGETGFLGELRHALAGSAGPGWLERAALAIRRAPADPCLLILGVEGEASTVASSLARLGRLIRRHGGVRLGRGPGDSWRRGRYQTPFLREPLMARGLGVDTFETVAPWSRLPDLRDAVIAALGNAAGGRIAAFCHLSHSYADAACLYFTALFPREPDALAQWRALKSAATGAILAKGGALSHHHGMGADHAPWAAASRGRRDVDLLAALRRNLDPERVMASGLARALA